MYIYIITNKSNTTFYTGVTNNLVRRIYEHKQQFVDGFTKKYNLNKLVYYEETSSPIVAIEREKEIKRNLSKSEKIKMIKQNNPELIDLYDEILQ